MKRLSGILLSMAIALAAYLLAPYLPLDAVTLAIILGALTANLIRLPEHMLFGINFGEKKILVTAIALLGFELDYAVLSSLGIPAVLMIVSGVAFTIAMGLLWGRIFGLDPKLGLLLGIGNGVCGSSAIAAAQGVVRAPEEDVALSIGIINLLGTIGIIALPALAVSLSGMNAPSEGKLIGNTLQAVGQVTAAGFSVSATVGRTALMIKMGRVLLLAPLVMALGALMRGKENRNGEMHVPLLPAYIAFFVIFSVIGSLKWLPANVTHVIIKVAKMLLVVAMASIGMRIHVRKLFKEASPALLAAVLVWFSQIGLTLLWVKL